MARRCLQTSTLFVTLAAELIAVTLLLPSFACAQSPFDGTWKINVSHAQFSDKPETFLLDNGEYRCSTCIPKVTVKADGHDQIVPGEMQYHTIAVKRLNDNAVQFTRKKDGKVVSESTDTVSPDGGTLTSEFKEYPLQGQPFSGKFIMTRVSAGPSGSHAISGSWKAAKLEDVSEDALNFTLKATPEGLEMKSGAGDSYDAKFDGKDYAVHGDRAGRTVALKKMNDTTIEETYKEDGKPIISSRMTVSGNTIKFVSKDLRRDTTESFTADKQ